MMRFSPFIRSLLLTATVLCAAIAASSAENDSGSDAQRDAQQKYDSISFAKGDFEISDPALVPRQLALAAEQARCVYQADIKEFPVHFVSASNRRLALVFCRLGVVGSHYVFDFADFRRPKLLELPFIAQNGGFGATPRPGLIIWKRDAGVFEAVTISDVCPNSELRHTYRLDSTGAVFSSPSLAVIRVEVREKPCGRNSTEWTTVWEASPWPAAATVR